MSKILVVDDEQSIQESLAVLLENQGYEIVKANDGEEALRRLELDAYDLVLSDIVMPRMDGLQLLNRVFQRWGRQLPVILITAHASRENAEDARAAGAIDLLIKPFDGHHLFDAIQKALGPAGAKAEKPELELMNSRMDAVQALFAAIEAKDQAALNHSARVACYAVLLAKRLNLTEEQLKNLEFLALLHDVGKIGLPDALLKKAAALTPDEEKAFQTHVLIGENILGSLRFIPEAGTITRHHHECYDGSGYPDGLAGETIPLFSRIIAIADACDLLLNACGESKACQEKVIDRMIEGEGRQFDPKLLRLFLATYCKLLMLNAPANG